MFESLTGSLQQVFKRLRGVGKLSEKDIKAAMRDVRMALLEADVQYQVAKDFIAHVHERCLGQAVVDSIKPGQQVIKYVHDELVELLGGQVAGMDFSAQPSAVVLLGLHGAGKTTTAGKLARMWKEEGHSVMLVGCDIRRPAAVDQLRILSEQVGVAFLGPEPGERVPAIGQRAMACARTTGIERLVFDTGGRFQIDEELVDELRVLQETVRARNVVLVLDAAIGQESVNVAEAFHKQVGLTGMMLTKLDGDARGGAALSVQKVTGCPILMVGTGEHTDNLEPFHPDRMASRILGMGDVVTLVERAQQNVDQAEMHRLEQRVMDNRLDLDDFLAQMQQLKKLGPVENLLEMLPGGANVSALDKAKMADLSGKELAKAEAVIRSMTADERKRPGIITGSRKRRIARGSGTDAAAVNDLLKRFDQARKMTKRLKKAQKKLSRLGM